MILSLLLWVQVAKLDVEVVPPTNPGVISVQVLMRLPQTGPVDRAELAILREVILDDTREYGHRQLVGYTAGTGELIRCDVYPDCLSLRFGVSVADSAAVVDILTNVIHDSELKEEVVNSALAAMTFRRQDYWSSGLDPEPLSFKAIRYEDIVSLYHRIGRPENLVLTIAAPAAIGKDLDERWRSATANWEIAPLRAWSPDHSAPKIAGLRAGKLSTYVLRDRPIDPKVGGFPAKLLALFALGGGKGSAVWKSLREGLGWSYRQEALLRNSQTGLEPVIEVVTQRSDADTDRALLVRPTLMKSVAAWTDADVVRALGSARALLERGVGLDPLYFKSTRPALSDELFMRTYWRMKTGADWDSQKLLGAMGNVDLKGMQAAANALLDGANVEIIRGRD